MKLKTLQTGAHTLPNIGIRSYQTNDAKAFFAAARESSAEVYPWLSWCHSDYSLADAEEWAESRRKLFEQGTEFEFVIVDSDDLFLGGCCLNHINTTDRIANIGYWVRTSATGCGVATQVVRQLTDFAFSQTNLERLEVICAVENIASQHVAEKAGAIREGILRGRLFLHDRPRDAVVYSILRSEYKK